VGPDLSVYIFVIYSYIGWVIFGYLRSMYTNWHILPEGDNSFYSWEWFFQYSGSVRFDGIVFLHNYITAIEWGLLVLILWVSIGLLLIYNKMYNSSKILDGLNVSNYNSRIYVQLGMNHLGHMLPNTFFFLSRLATRDMYSWWRRYVTKYKYLDYIKGPFLVKRGERVSVYPNWVRKGTLFNLLALSKNAVFNYNLNLLTKLTNYIVNKFGLFNKFVLFNLHKDILKVNNLKWSVFGRLTFLNSRVVHGQKLEIIWTVIPTVILVFIAYPSFFLLYTIEEILPTSLWSRALGRQWYWVYEYSWLSKLGGKTIVEESYLVLENQIKYGLFRLFEVDNSLLLPVGLFMRFIVSASDVIHSFAIPSLGLKADGVPGRLNSTSTFVKRPGIYYGQCSELCGVGHGFMPIKALCLLFCYWVELFDFNLRTSLCMLNPVKAIHPVLE
jgi:hypothetical protein